MTNNKTNKRVGLIICFVLTVQFCNSKFVFKMFSQLTFFVENITVSGCLLKYSNSTFSYVTLEMVTNCKITLFLLIK